MLDAAARLLVVAMEFDLLQPDASALGHLPDLRRVERPDGKEALGRSKVAEAQQEASRLVGFRRLAAVRWIATGRSKCCFR